MVTNLTNMKMTLKERLKDYLMPREQISLVSPVITLIPVPKKWSTDWDWAYGKVGRIDQCRHNAAKQQLIERKYLQEHNKLGKMEPVKGEEIEWWWWERLILKQGEGSWCRRGKQSNPIEVEDESLWTDEKLLYMI